MVPAEKGEINVAKVIGLRKEKEDEKSERDEGSPRVLQNKKKKKGKEKEKEKNQKRNILVGLCGENKTSGKRRG